MQEELYSREKQESGHVANKPPDKAFQSALARQYDLLELQKLQDEFAGLHHVAMVLLSPAGIPLTAPVHFSSLLQGMVFPGSTSGSLSSSCASQLKDEFLSEKFVVKEMNNSGIYTACIPVVINENYLGSWMLMQLSNAGHKRETIIEYGKSCGLEPDELMDSISFHGGMPYERFEAITFFFRNQVKRDCKHLSDNNILIKQVKEKEQTEFKLQKSKANLRAIFDTTPQIYFLIDKDYKILTLNKNARYLIKQLFDKEIAAGNNLLYYFPGHEQQYIRESLAESFKGKYIHAERNDVFSGTDDKLYSIYFYPAYNELNEVFAVSFSLQDITAIRHAGKLADNERKLLLTMINNMPDIIFIKNKEGRFMVANKAVANLMGKQEGRELTGKSDFDFFSQEVADKFYRDEQEIIQTGVPMIDKEEIITHADGSERWYSLSKVPFRNEEGKTVGIIGIGRDITERIQDKTELNKAREEAEKADKLKSTFLANISHEIRTPMNGIIGFTEILKNEEIPEGEREKYLDIISKNSLHLLNLLNEIIDFSKIESGQLRLVKSEFNLNAILNEIYITYQAELAMKRKDQLEFIFSPGLPDNECQIFSDPDRLGQILENLLENALKFTSQGSITFGYSLSRGEDRLEFFVTDTGIGIPSEKQHIIFSGFRQADDSATRNYDGTGLGLAISSGVVELFGGSLSVRSESGGGSCFTFDIPFIPVAAVKSKMPFEAEEIERLYNWKGKEILLADDDEYSMLFLQKLLKPTGAILYQADNGTEAIKHCKNNPYIHCMLMDLNIPRISAYQAMQLIRQINPGMYIIAYTAGVNKVSAEMEMLADEIIIKPLDGKKILDVTDHHFSREG